MQSAGANRARTPSEHNAQDSDELLSAIKYGDASNVRAVLLRLSEEKGKAALTTPSLAAEQCQRSPLMLAAMRGDMAIFTTLMHALDRLHPDNVRVKL